MNKLYDSTKKLVVLGGLLVASLTVNSQVLFDNGPFFNSAGTGSGGANESVLYTTTFGMSTIGFGHQQTSFNRVADDFTITDCAWRIDSVVFFGYQTGSTTTSTFTGVNFRVWDSIPDAPGSSVVFGDTTTNRLIRTVWSGAYRITETTTGNTSRPIMRNVCTMNSTIIPAGTYWLDWSSAGSLGSGPWAPARTPVMVAITGNGRQRIGSVWNNLVDGGTNTPAQGLPFIIYGTALNASADAGTAGAYCTSGQVQLGGTTPGSGYGSLTYAWSPATALSSTSIGNPLASPSASTNYVLTVTDALGCIAMDTVAVTVNQPSTATINATVCTSYSSPAGNTYTASGTYTDTLVNGVGCDSIITINLVVNAPSTSVQNIASCDTTYLSPAGNTYTSSGTYYDTIPNTLGCDSIITTNLAFYTATQSAISATACVSYVAPSGAMYTTSGTYMDTISNVNGCDSIITISLVIDTATYGSLTTSACGSYTSPGGAIYTASGTYMDTITGSNGCDSIITISLIILSPTQSAINVSSCGSYTAPSGAVYTTSGTYVDTIPNSSGCDSLITITLNATVIDTGLSLLDPFTAMSQDTTPGATYQWLYCDNNYSPVPIGNTQIFNNGYVNGNFAVAITVGNCTDTSACIMVAAWGIEEYNAGKLIGLYPNPNNGTFMLDLPKHAQKINIRISDITGRVLWSSSDSDKKQVPVSFDGPAGMYVLTVQTESYTATKNMVITK
jgi:hypothetical protein